MYKNFDEVVEFATNFRHNLHKNPELTWEETNTAKAIREILDKHNITYKTYAGTGTVGLLAQDKKGPHIALRGDIDALPLEEKTDVSYKSVKHQCMHACGHDGHTATLMAAAIWLKQNEDKLTNPVSLIFQPAEEGGHGAKKMIEEGCLDGIDMIFGWHNWPAIKFGQAVCPEGTVMAGNGTFHITLKGLGGHSSQPEICKDPVLAASALTMALQQIASRQVAPQDAVVVSVTSIDAISGVTVIPDNAKVEGSIRVPTNELKTKVFNQIEEISKGIALAYNVDVDIDLRDRYQPTINHKDEASKVREVLKDTLGENWQSNIATPIMASEDFSYYLNKIPGAFALVGSDDGIEKHQKACHNVHYDFNDKLIKPVSISLMKLANFKF
ncbi:N(2)-acetyl-L-2,4-diaminobutanoate deacetylase DoeB2 [Arcobacter sp. KX21116]|uniref:N(2)-acetyl-L-2,4-diaminobutanoate deacetylase DoeB2 n=1 Tax=Arcobacter TaxID=28196 RepID=UPI0035D41519|eukprot:TRINITY_DN38496_c0_g2_i2.p1 TRINITY_DN38496_c0_g2~~TRINITY_DN38496_c0_g2_i2.p1  ORF type:complete len:385 (+),score=-24.65 TRINITY_DN38496_c0_g2_i2:182-1336(+)